MIKVIPLGLWGIFLKKNLITKFIISEINCEQSVGETVENASNVINNTAPDVNMTKRSWIIVVTGTKASNTRLITAKATTMEA